MCHIFLPCPCSIHEDANQKSKAELDSFLPHNTIQAERTRLNVNVTRLPIHTANLLQDNLKIGKSCRHDGAHWDCRDCGLTGSKEWEQCSPLQRRNACFEIPRPEEWDSPHPRSHSYLDPTASQHATRNILSHYGMTERYEQISCDMTDDYCFNLSRCSPQGPLKVFAHTRQVHGWLESDVHRIATRMARTHPHLVQKVSNASESCLVLASCNSYGTFEQLKAAHGWNHGQNHFFWAPNKCYGAFGDYPFDKANFAKAALATSTLTDASLRKGFDMPIARVRGHSRFEFGVSTRVLDRVRSEVLAPATTTSQQQRKWLLAYKGKTHKLSQVWWQHRWLAYEFWDPTDEQIAVDMVCVGNGRVMEKPHYTNQYDYVDMLANSTFAFCPGGGSTNSYRFAEALGLGAIPVVTADFLPPFWPELDWSDCLVHVSEARIVDLPRLLRAIPKEQVHKRQRRCHALFEKTIGWAKYKNEQEMRIESIETAFLAAIKVWSWRIRHEYRVRQLKEELGRDFFQMP